MSAQPTENIDNFIELVNSQSAFHRDKAEQYADQPDRAAHHRRLSNQFALLGLFLMGLSKDGPTSSAAQNRKGTSLLALTPEDLDGLPPEVLAELNVSDADRLHFTILDIINDNGGQISLDQVIIGVYRRTKELLRRQKATSVLYRMAQKGLIHHVPGVKGAYSIDPVEKEVEDNLEDLV